MICCLIIDSNELKGDIPVNREPEDPDLVSNQRTIIPTPEVPTRSARGC